MCNQYFPTTCASAQHKSGSPHYNRLIALNSHSQTLCNQQFPSPLGTVATTRLANTKPRSEALYHQHFRQHFRATHVTAASKGFINPLPSTLPMKNTRNSRRIRTSQKYVGSAILRVTTLHARASTNACAPPTKERRTKSTHRNYFLGLIHRWREKHIPEMRRRGRKFHRHQRSFAGDLRRSHHASLHHHLRLRIFHGNLRAFRQRLWNNNHRPVGVYRMREPAKRWLSRDVDHHRHAQQHALRAAPFFRGGLTCQPGLGTVSRIRMAVRPDRGFSINQRTHNSIPQKSISGATNSIPYSQPSGRGLPFQTITAALLLSVARFVSARRCSRSKDCSRTTMQPYGLTTRVCASTRTRGPLPGSHSRRTGTREFIRRPRRLSPWRVPEVLDSRVFTGIVASVSHARVRCSKRSMVQTYLRDGLNSWPLVQGESPIATPLFGLFRGPLWESHGCHSRCWKWEISRRIMTPVAKKIEVCRAP